MTGDAVPARATRSPTRAMLRCLGLSASIAIALAGCDAGPPVAAFECVEAHPGWRSPERFTFAAVRNDPYPTGCRYVTDTEGWQRKMCESGPDQYVCRATVASGMPPSEDPKGLRPKAGSPTGKAGDAR